MKSMGLRKSLTLISLMFSVSAFGAAEGSEFQHQAPVSTFELTPTLEYKAFTTKLKAVGFDKAEISELSEGLMGEYGLNDMLSLGFLLKHSSSDNKYSPSGATKDTSAKGLKDPDFFVNGQVAAGPGSFRFGTHLSFSMEDRKTDASEKSNMASGGALLTPFVGYETILGPHAVGARMAYTLYKGEQKRSDSSSGTKVDSTVKGGEVLTTALFYEYDSQPVTLGVSFELQNQRSTKTTKNGNTTDNNNPVSIYGLSVYAPVLVAPNITILPKVTYNAYGAYDSTNIDSVTGWTVQVGARFAF